MRKGLMPTHPLQEALGEGPALQKQAVVLQGSSLCCMPQKSPVPQPSSASRWLLPPDGWSHRNVVSAPIGSGFEFCKSGGRIFLSALKYISINFSRTAPGLLQETKPKPTGSHFCHVLHQDFKPGEQKEDGLNERQPGAACQSCK